jgi:hypothetical protein
MVLSWNSTLTLLVAALVLFFFIFAIWAIRTYFRSKKADPIQSEQTQVSYCRPDPVLRHSLYSCPKLDMTNPRDSVSSLVLSDDRYSAPPPAYSRPPSFISSTIHPRESLTNLAHLRQSIYGDDDSIFEGPRNSSATSLVPTRTSSPASSRRQSMHNSVYGDTGPSLAALRYSIYGDSNPVFANPRGSSTSLRQSRAASLSPTRMAPRQSSSDLSLIRGRQPSRSLADLRHSLYSDASPMCAHPENPGITLFAPRSRTASIADFSATTNRYSCPEFTHWEQSLSFSPSSTPTPPQESAITMPPARSQPKTNENRSTPSTVLGSEYPPRPKTANTSASSSLTVPEFTHLSGSNTSNTAHSSPATALESEYPSRPKTSTTPRPSSLAVQEFEYPSRPKTSNELHSTPLTALESEHPSRPKTSTTPRPSSVAVREFEYPSRPEASTAPRPSSLAVQEIEYPSRPKTSNTSRPSSLAVQGFEYPSRPKTSNTSRPSSLAVQEFEYPSRPKTSNTSRPSSLAVQGFEYPSRPKTSNTLRSSTLTVQEFEYPSRPVTSNTPHSTPSTTLESEHPSRSKTSNTPEWPLKDPEPEYSSTPLTSNAQGWPLRDSESEYHSRPKTSNEPRWPFTDLEPENPSRPRTSNEPRILRRQVLDPEYAPPAPAYIPSMSPRCLSRAGESQAACQPESVRRASTRHLAGAASNEYVGEYDYAEFAYLSQYVRSSN